MSKRRGMRRTRRMMARRRGVEGDEKEEGRLRRRAKYGQKGR